MPRASKLLQFLRELDVTELETLRRTYASRISRDLARDELSRRLKKSLSRRIRQKDITFQEIVREALESVKKDDHTKVVPFIKKGLARMTFSRVSMWESRSTIRESWFSSEALQVLTCEFRERPYVVRQEKKFEDIRVDICVSREDGKANYPIEVKRSNNMSSLRRLSGQLDSHRENVPYHRKSFALVIAEDEEYHPENNISRSRIVGGVRRRSDAKAVVKGPGDIRK